MYKTYHLLETTSQWKGHSYKNEASEEVTNSLHHYHVLVYVGETRENWKNPGTQILIELTCTIAAMFPFIPSIIVLGSMPGTNVEVAIGSASPL